MALQNRGVVSLSLFFSPRVHFQPSLVSLLPGRRGPDGRAECVVRLPRQLRQRLPRGGAVGGQGNGARGGLLQREEIIIVL